MLCRDPLKFEFVHIMLQSHYVYKLAQICTCVFFYLETLSGKEGSIASASAVEGREKP